MLGDSKQEQLNQAVQEVHDERLKTIKLIDDAANEAAQLVIDSMKFSGTEGFEFKTQEIRMEAADRVLDMAGFKAKRVELSGTGGIVINITPEHANKVHQASQLTSGA